MLEPVIRPLRSLYLCGEAALGGMHSVHSFMEEVGNGKFSNSLSPV